MEILQNFVAFSKYMDFTQMDLLILIYFLLPSVICTVKRNSYTFSSQLCISLSITQMDLLTYFDMIFVAKGNLQEFILMYLQGPSLRILQVCRWDGRSENVGGWKGRMGIMFFDGTGFFSAKICCKKVTTLQLKLPFFKIMYISHSVHRTHNFMNPEFQFPQFKVF